MQISDLQLDSENCANKCPLASYVISQSFQNTISHLPKENSNTIHHFGITPPYTPLIYSNNPSNVPFSTLHPSPSLTALLYP